LETELSFYIPDKPVQISEKDYRIIRIISKSTEDGEYSTEIVGKDINGGADIKIEGPTLCKSETYMRLYHLTNIESFISMYINQHD